MRRKIIIACFILMSVVSTNAVAGAFNDEGNGTVTDFITGLVWQQDGASVRTFENATRYCEELILDGSDWRLPEIKELSSLIDYTVSEVSIDKRAFPNAVGGQHWSGTSFVNNSGVAWHVAFDDPSRPVNRSSKMSKHYVRCVR